MTFMDMDMEKEKSLQDIENEIIDEFSIFDDWLDKYEYIIELGKSLEEYPEDRKTDDKLVKGCQSRVWIDFKVEDGKIFFNADSDAIINHLASGPDLFRKDAAGDIVFRFLCSGENRAEGKSFTDEGKRSCFDDSDDTRDSCKEYLIRWKCLVFSKRKRHPKIRRRKWHLRGIL